MYVLAALGHEAPKHSVECYPGCVSLKEFWMRLTFEPADWVKQVVLPNVWVGFNQSTEDLNRTKSWVRGNSSCLTTRAWTSRFPPFGLWDINLLAFSGLPTHHQFSWFLGLCTWTRTTPTFLGLHLVDCRSWDFSAPINTWANYL